MFLDSGSRLRYVFLTRLSRSAFVNEYVVPAYSNDILSGVVLKCSYLVTVAFMILTVCTTFFLPMTVTFSCLDTREISLSKIFIAYLTLTTNIIVVKTNTKVTIKHAMRSAFVTNRVVAVEMVTPIIKSVSVRRIKIIASFIYSLGKERIKETSINAGAITAKNVAHIESWLSASTKAMAINENPKYVRRIAIFSLII
jgi:hypothetical protein